MSGGPQSAIGTGSNVLRAAVSRVPARRALGGTQRMSQSLGTFFVIAGLLLVGIGVLAWSGLLGWFGRLPGDIRIESGDSHLFIPITSMLAVSVVLSILVHLVRRFFG